MKSDDFYFDLYDILLIMYAAKKTIPDSYERFSLNARAKGGSALVFCSFVSKTAFQTALEVAKLREQYNIDGSLMLAAVSSIIDSDLLDESVVDEILRSDEAGMKVIKSLQNEKGLIKDSFTRFFSKKWLIDSLKEYFGIDDLGQGKESNNNKLLPIAS